MCMYTSQWWCTRVQYRCRPRSSPSVVGCWLRPGTHCHIRYVLSVFLCAWIEWSEAFCFCPVCLFCLFVCLSVVNFNLRYNFWTVRDWDSIFGMNTPLMMPFKWHQCQWPCDFDFDLEARNSFLDFVATGDIVFHKHTLIFVNLPRCFLFWLSQVHVYRMLKRKNKMCTLLLIWSVTDGL